MAESCIEIPRPPMEEITFDATKLLRSLGEQLIPPISTYHTVGSLEDNLRPAANVAVDRAVHAADPKLFHKRYAKGRCPLCSLLVNIMESADLPERIQEMAAGLMQKMDADDAASCDTLES